MVREEYNHSRPVSALIRDWLLYNKAGGGGGIIKTVTGNPISVSDALAAPIQSLSVSLSPIQDLHGQDSPYPAGGGKNLFDPSAATVGVNWNGNALAYSIASDYIPVVVGETYTLSVSDMPKFTGVVVAYLDADKAYKTNTANMTFTVPADTAFVRISFRCASDQSWTDSDLSAAKIQLEKGFSASAWSPYENICPISGRIGVTVERTGANVFGGDALKADVVANISKATDASDDAVAVGVQGTGSLSFGAFKANTQYTIILDVLSGGTYLGASFEYTDGTKKTVGSGYTANTRSAKAFTSDANKTIDHIVLSKGAPAYTIYCNTSGIFEGALTAAEFEPYDGQTAPIYFGGTGKNLYDPDADGYAKIFLPEGTKLTASANSRVTIEYYDSSKTRIDFWSLNQVSGNRYFRSFTLSQDTYYFRFTTPDADCQLELGLTPTDYDEPAVTVYGGTVDVITGKATIAWKKYIGSAFASASARTGGFYARMNLGVTYAGGQITPALYACNRAVYGGNRYDKWYFYAAGNIGGTVNYVHMYIPADAIDYHEGDNITALLNAAYNASDFEFVLPLAEPFDIDLTPAQLTTLRGDNTVWSDGDSVEMTYIADPKLYIDKKITAAVAALA